MVNRLNYIDALRGFAMILVVIGHVLFYGGMADSFGCYAIYSFHMPLFFAISGFVAQYTFRLTGVGSYMLKISKRLLVPYILWSILYCGISYYIDKTNIPGIPISDYWFIPCLWGLLAIFGLVEHLSNYKSIYVKLGLILVVLLF